MDLLIRGGTVVGEEKQRRADILVREGKIVEISETIVPPGGHDVVDATGMLVLPGVIDVHTHYGMVGARGVRTADDFYQGSVSAAAGGVTTVIDYADPMTGESLPEAALKRRLEAEEGIAIDFSLHVVVSKFGQQDVPELAALAEQGITSLGEIFTSHPSLKIDTEDLRLLLVKARDAGILATMHAEDDLLIQEAGRVLRQAGQDDKQYHGISRPIEAEVTAIKGLIEMAAELECPLYIVHVSSGEGAKAIADARRAGLLIMGETCPHYLLLNEGRYRETGAALYIMNPPLREAANNDALWAALADGTLQVVTTDHCSYTRQQKEASSLCFEIMPGVPGSETLLPLLYTEGVGKGRIELPRLVQLLSSNPARIFGIYPQKGTIAVGSDADMVIFDPVKEVTITALEQHSAAGYTLFEGWKVKGYPRLTLLRGQVIFRDGQFCGERGAGRFIPAHKGQIL
ncbi:MAG: dihydropyrimidinase [Peptococcaceae bacterium]|nr:dihydropyrimidinase [Peptococcaceae bacterium]